VVLPFAHLGSDPDEQYFADGVTEDLTTDLSRLADMVVISRNTAFTFKDKRVDTRQIGRELGVRYVLEGSVRRLGNQVRVNAQLIDAETDAHLWAERFDGDAGDPFALQDWVTRRIALALDLELIRTEASRKIEYPDAFDYILRGRAAAAKPPTRDDYADAIDWFERALALDPHSAEAQSLLADALAGRVVDQMTDTAVADIARAQDLVARALARRAARLSIMPSQYPAPDAQMRRGYFRIPDRDRVRSQRAWRLCQSRLVQAPDRRDRGGDPGTGTGPASQPPR